MYHSGWARREIAITPRGFGMQGYGNWHQKDCGHRTKLFARALYLAQDQQPGLIFCCLDTGYVTLAMRQGVCGALAAGMGSAFDEERFCLTCTHTHSGPGGCTHDVMYNLVTPGFVPEYLDAIVAAASAAILEAWRGARPCTLARARGSFAPAVPVAWNRSLAAYNRNPDVTRRAADETHLAIDREMQLLVLTQAGQAQAILSLFGVHATCIGRDNRLFDADNKGYAACAAEAALAAAGAEAPVAIFAQATAGDVSPHYHGPGQRARRLAIRGEAEFAYAQANGEMQAARALDLLAAPREEISGAIDAALTYVDFTSLTADPGFAGGHAEAVTSEPAHGVAFFQGTPVDGPGLPKALAWLLARMARRLRRRHLRGLAAMDPADQAYYRRLYAAQGVKDVLQESGRKRMLGAPLGGDLIPDFIDPAVAETKRQARAGAMVESAMVPSVLPLQILIIGTLAILCCPGEFTTMAGARLRASTQARLRPRGITQVLLSTYCNDYMGYVTTFEEYQQQAYEGGHTIFGQWTLAAFQTCFAALADQLCRPVAARAHDRTTRPRPAPPAELALRTAPPAR